MLRVACCYRSCFLSFLGNITSRGHFGSNWEHLNKKLNRWLKRNEHEPGGSDSIQMHNMHINLIAHSQVKTWNPTPECPNQIYPYVEVFHSLFTSFSRPFHEFFTVFSDFWVLRCSCVFLRQFQRKPWRLDFKTTNYNFRSSKYRTGTLTAAILQIGGTLTSRRQHFLLLVPHQR